MALGRRDRAARRSGESRCGARCFPPRPRFVGCADRPGRTPAPPSGREPPGRPVGLLPRGCSPCCSPSGRVLEERVGHSVGVMVGVDDQEIDRADETTCADRGSKGQDGPTHDDALCLGDEDARLRQVDELAHEVRGIERARVTVDTKVCVAQGDETIDIGDTGCSDQVFHAEGSYLAGRRPLPLARGPPTPGSVPGGQRPCRLGEREARDTRVDATAGVRPTGIAFGSPVAMIRHRFGGHLRAARARSCNARPSRIAVRPADALGGHRRRVASMRATGGLASTGSGVGRATGRRSLRVSRTTAYQEENA